MISVIIPVYNVEDYLNQCVCSVLVQSYQNIEVILVDDGSTDNSGKICDGFEKYDSRVRVIHKINGGSSDARNTGLEDCIGEYIVFLDSDDYWCEDFLSDIIEIINIREGVEVIIGDSYCELLPKGTRKDNICNMDSNNFDFIDGENALEYLFTFKNKEGTMWFWSACKNIYKVSFLRDNKLYFKKGIICGEDAEWTPRVILAAKSLALYLKPFYMYRLSRPNSIMNTLSMKSITGYLEVVENWIYYSEKIGNRKLARAICENSVIIFMTILNIYIYLIKNQDVY